MANLAPPPLRTEVLDKSGFFNRVWWRWFSDLYDYIANIVSKLDNGEPIFTSSPAHNITNTDITHWNTAYDGIHAPVTINGDGIELIGQQISLTQPLQQLSGGRVLIGKNFSLLQDVDNVRLYYTSDGGATWTDTGTHWP